MPLFVDRYQCRSRAWWRNGNREIPATLHDSLMARLDRLGPATEIAQVAAVIGREFSYELLHAIHPLPDDESRSH